MILVLSPGGQCAFDQAFALVPRVSREIRWDLRIAGSTWSCSPSVIRTRTSPFPKRQLPRFGDTVSTAHALIENVFRMVGLCLRRRDLTFIQKKLNQGMVPGHLNQFAAAHHIQPAVAHMDPMGLPFVYQNGK